jgi:Major Facilitator Superfamily
LIATAEAPDTVDLRSERLTWTLVYLCLGVIEGGTAAVMVRSLFSGAVGGVAVDLVLAIVSAAPAWANLLSLAYARRAQGRPKVRFLRPLLVAMAVCVGSLALLPVGGVGLVAFLLLYGVARLLWAGVDTVRSVIWSVNYPRHLRARVTGRIMVNGSIALATSGLLLGWLLEHDDPWYRAAIVAAAVAGLAGSVACRGMRVRQEQRLLEDERARVKAGARFDLAGVRQLLTSDTRFRRYMLAMSVFGAGHLMLTPLLVICIDDVLQAPELVQVAITAALPVIVMPLAIQPWARFLDRHHVIEYRSVHAWVAVSGVILLCIAVLARLPWLLWPGALLMGISQAAGSLGWSLGHNDFAPRGEETRYMALHVTLTGLRGLLAPPMAIFAYHGLRRALPGLEPWTMLLPAALIIIGAWQFTAMRSEIPAASAGA